MEYKNSFLLLYISRFISVLCSGIVYFAIVWWMSGQSNAYFSVANAAIFGYLPYILLGSWVGIIVDKFEKKKVLLAGNAIVGLLGCILSVLFFIGRINLIFVYIILFFRSIAGMLSSPALYAVVGMLIPKEKLLHANGWLQTMQSVSFMITAMLGAGIVSMLPIEYVMLVDVFGQIVSSAILLKFRNPVETHTPRQNMLREFRCGLDTLFKAKILLIMSVGVIIAVFFSTPLSTLFPVYAREQFHSSVFGFGAVQTAYSTGLFVSSVAMGISGRALDSEKLILLGIAGLGTLVLFSGILPENGFPVLCVIVFFIGIFDNMYLIAHTTLIQKSVRKDMLARVYSLCTSVMSLSTLSGLLLAGYTSTSFGMRRCLLYTAAFLIGLSVILFLFRRREGEKKEDNC